MCYASREIMIKVRREAVSRLRIRGLSVRAMVEALPKMNPPILNPKGEPFARTTIGKDLIAVQEQWLEASKANVDVYMSRQLAILEEVQREAWKSKNLKHVMASSDRIARLLGTNATEKREVTGKDGEPIGCMVIHAASEADAKTTPDGQ